MTLLEIVQDILSDMDSDEVNSINDTAEATQVAQIVKSTYYSIINVGEWPHLKRTIQLQSSGSSAYPTHMRVQDTIRELVSLSYNCIKTGETKKNYQPMRWKEPDDFLRYINSRNSDNSNVDVINDYGGIELLIMNDRAPTYFTSFDDDYIVFDSYDSVVDTTLQSSKIQARAIVIPSWTNSDTAIPDLPDEAFTKLLEESKSRAMFKLKQVQDVKAENESMRQSRHLSRQAFRVKGGIQYPDYGRKPAGYTKNPYFDKT